MRLEDEFKKLAKESEGTVEVDISYDIISHVSKQLYSNPRKAIEELVCNSYDAGASKCWVRTPKHKDDFLCVLDNGVSMDFAGLKNLWKVAVSPKESLGQDRTDNDRMQIGKFGVGKLAAYSLGNRLTHVATTGGVTRIVSVGQTQIKDCSGGQKPAFMVYKLPEETARKALQTYFSDLPKPWEEGFKTWTMAIVDEIDPGVSGSLKLGFLRRMIRNALPVSSRFLVYLDGVSIPKRQIQPDKILVRIDVDDQAFRERLEKTLEAYWRTYLALGEDKEVPSEYYKCEAIKIPDPESVRDSIQALNVPKLGPLSGYAIVAKDTLTTESLQERGYRDNGFCIHVRGRQINPEDELFGITQRTHLYWRRFLAEVEIPSLDGALLVQRNFVSEGRVESQIAREVLKELFNEARNRAEAIEEAGEYVPPPFGARMHVLSPFISPLAIRGLAGGELSGQIVDVKVDFVALGEGGPPCTFDAKGNVFLVNEDHPLIASLDEKGEKVKQLRHVLAEVIAGTLMESGYLRSQRVPEGLIQECGAIVDDALRSAVGYLADPAERHIREIEEASYVGGKRFEMAVVRVFRDLRLSADRRGQPEEPDAIITLPRAGQKNLLISVEAKGSKGVVTHAELHSKTVDRQRKEAGCDKAIAIAREYVQEGIGGKKSALVRETQSELPLITTRAIAKILRLHKKRPFTNDKIEKILTTWIPPSDLEAFIESVWKELPEPGLLRDIISVAWEIQKRDENNPPDPGMIVADERIRCRGIKRAVVERVVEAVEITTHMVLIRDPISKAFELLSDPETILETMQRSADEANEGVDRKIRN